MTVKTPFMQQQKMLMYVFPVMFAVFGINFPVGVLVYWLTTNVWTMGQQMFVIRRNPTPGSLAYQQRQERLNASGRLKEEPKAVNATDGAEEPQAVPAKRTQPKRQSKAQRQTTGAPRAGTADAKQPDAKQSGSPVKRQGGAPAANPKPNLSKKK
jgi:YidC/Oxa1 family membrane protein insertase